MFNLLGKIFDSSKLSGDYDYLTGVVDFLDRIVVPLTVILLVGAAIMAICIGVVIAKAESSDKAAEMKKRLWGLMITVVVVIALTWVLGFILSNYETVIGSLRDFFDFGKGRGTSSIIRGMML